MTGSAGGPLDAVPAAPRTPTWGASLRPVRSFALVSTILFAIAAIGAVITWGMADFANPFDDGTLDALRAERALGTADAVVTTVEELGRNRSEPIERVNYEWSLNGEPRTAVAYADAGTFRTGATYGMEFVPDDPTVNRLVGSTRSIMARSMVGWGTTLAIATTLLLLTLRRILAIRTQLRDGPASLARVDNVHVRGRSLDIEFRLGHEDPDTSAHGSLPRSHPAATGLRRGEIETVTVILARDGRRPLVVTARDFVPAARAS